MDRLFFRYATGRITQWDRSRNKGENCSINDKHGLHAGDLALRHLARLLSESAGVSDFVVRFAGDEFVVLACDRTQASSLITILEATLSANLLRLEDGNELSITVSIGASHYPEDGANADELYKREDERNACIG